MTKGTEIRYRVRGGAPLQGTVFIQGAKNAALTCTWTPRPTPAPRT